MFKKLKHSIKIKNFKFKINQGFTLIELLIVIVIIGILSGFLMSNFIGVRQRARDSQRKADLRQIQSALELYRSDQGIYPTSVPYPNLTPPCGGSLAAPTPTVVYMQRVPCDPLGITPTPYQYCPYNSNSNYAVRACLENANDPQADGNLAATPTPIASCTFTACSSGVYYTLTNP